MRSKVPVVGHFVGCAIISRTSASTEIKSVEVLGKTHIKKVFFCGWTTKRGGSVNHPDH